MSLPLLAAILALLGIIVHFLVSVSLLPGTLTPPAWGALLVAALIWLVPLI